MPANMGFPSPPPIKDPTLLQKLLAGLAGTPANAGAVDPATRQAAQRQALMAMSAQLLAGSGPSPQRQSFGSIAGQSLLAGQQANQQGIDSALQTQLLMSQIQRNKQTQQQRKLTTVGAGGAVLDENGKVVYTNPAKQGEGPSNWEEWVRYNELSPDDQKRYLEMKRNQNALQLVDVAGGKNIFNKASGALNPVTTAQQEASGAAQIAGAQSQARATGEITGAREGSAPTAYAAYQSGVKSLESAMGGTETGPIAGRIPAITAAQQTAEGAEATMAPILKQLFRQAGEGTFTDSDQALLMKMVPTRKDHPEARKAKIEMIDGIVRAKLGIDAGGATSGAAPASNPNIDALLDKYAPK